MSFGWNKRKLTGREKRFLLYFTLFVGVLAWKFIPRPWRPTVELETAHYRIRSSAALEQARQVGTLVETLHQTYSNLLGGSVSMRVPAGKLCS